MYSTPQMNPNSPMYYNPQMFDSPMVNSRPVNSRPMTSPPINSPTTTPRATSRPMTSPPPMPLPMPLTACMLDELDDRALDDVVDQATAMYGGSNGAALGDLTKCKAVKTNRIISIVSLVVQACLLVTIVFLLGYKGDNTYLTYQFKALIALAAVLMAVWLRNPISLVGRMAWFGSGANTKALIVLTFLLVAATSVMPYVRNWQMGNLCLLMFLAAVITSKIVFLSRLMAKPESTVFVAGSSALNRMASTKNIKKVFAV